MLPVQLEDMIQIMSNGKYLKLSDQLQHVVISLRKPRKYASVHAGDQINGS